MKVILGAGDTKLDGWISTQEKDLNLLDRSNFKSILKNVVLMLCLQNMFGSI
ncbi:hypothetical protein H477_2355 [[Clostridium] sordellii ATCC 9714]|nr:hypothetical protein H477_2355 [[Clostridium] sordellii ATCC 9714] [Paeniclostridium sordellii ATCC 9714]